MDDPIITMEEYIRLEEEKAQSHGKTFNWQTATFGISNQSSKISPFKSLSEYIQEGNFTNCWENDPDGRSKRYYRGIHQVEEEKARKHGKMFNWETTKYGRIWYDEDVYDFKSVENEFQAIAFNDSLTSGETLSCKPTVSSHNDEIDFKISFDDSDDEDYMDYSPMVEDFLCRILSWFPRPS
nr:hypothetical protein [Tanacetum cinerariifolium]